MGVDMEEPNYRDGNIFLMGVAVGAITMVLLGIFFA
jgi:hypothetical protein